MLERHIVGIINGLAVILHRPTPPLRACAGFMVGELANHMHFLSTPTETPTERQTNTHTQHLLSTFCFGSERACFIVGVDGTNGVIQSNDEAAGGGGSGSNNWLWFRGGLLSASGTTTDPNQHNTTQHNTSRPFLERRDAAGVLRITQSSYRPITPAKPLYTMVLSSGVYCRVTACNMQRSIR